MRTSRSLSLTQAGRDFYESAVRLISDLEAAESRIGSGQASPSGVVRVTAAHAFSRRARTVRRILRGHEREKITISAVRPAARRQPSKVAVFVEFLAELLAEEGD